jgi:hypothetical protein
MKVFISYSRRDKRSQMIGKKLFNFLCAREINVILDEKSFLIGKTISKEIADGIFTADKFIFIASKEALKSQYILTEIESACTKAIELFPKIFFHIVMVDENLEISFLPNELKGYLCHMKKDKTELKLFYEIFLSLYEINIGKLERKMLSYDPRSTWIIPELFRRITINSRTGDAEVSTLRTIMSISNNIETETRLSYLWPEKGDLPKRIKVKAEECDGKPLNVYNKRIMFRGKETLSYKIIFNKPIRKEEMYSYWTKYSWKSKFDLLNGDQYQICCDDMIYGYMRLVFTFPRNIIVDKIDLQFESPTKKLIQSVPKIGQNIYSHTTLETELGSNYIFRFKCS